MHRVLITDNLSAGGLQVLRDCPAIEVVEKSKLTVEQLKAELQEADGIIIRSATKLTADVLEGQTRLKAIVRAGVGVDNIDLAAATRAGIVVMNTPAGNTTSTAEHTVAMLMALSRSIAPAGQSMKEGRWDRKLYTGTQLAGKTIGVVGLGRIGMTVARRCRALEMTVLGFDPFTTAERAAEFGIRLFQDLDELLVQCDFVTVHTSLTDETRGLINAERLKRMKKGVRIINCARGGIVDEEALADAIEAGHVAGAAMDVFVDEPPKPECRLPKLPQVLCTPHLGASTEEAQEQVALEAAEIMTGFLARGEVRHAVNMVPVAAEELPGLRPYLDLAYRLGLLLAQLTKGHGVRGAHLQIRGEAASKPRQLIVNAFTAGLMSAAFEERVHIVNADMMAKEHGLVISESTDNASGAFTTLIACTVKTDKGETTAAGTTFGNEFLRLVRLNEFQMETYLDGLMLLYWHRDVPGLIGAIGTTMGKHKVNISHMALGREKHEPGGLSVAILNLDNAPSAAAVAEASLHPEVTGLDLVTLPPAGASLPWLGL